MRTNTRLALAVCALSLGACMHKVDQRQAAAIKRVGLLSITMDRIGASPSDLDVLQRALDTAPAAYEAALKTANPQWEVVPLASYRDNPAYARFLAPDSPVLTEMAQKSLQMQMAAKMLHPEGGTNGMVIRWVGTQSAPFLGASGLPLIPYVAARAQGTTTTTRSGNATTSVDDSGMHTFFDQSIGALADKLGLDALAVVYLRTEVKATVGITTVVNGRGIDSIRMKPTMLVINRQGKIAVDMGEPVIDDLSQRAVGAPVYRLDYHAGGRLKDDKGPYDLVLDLNDPQGKVLPDIQDLIARTSQTAGEKIAKEMTAGK